MNAILERALEKVRSAKRRISEAVEATNSAEEEEWSDTNCVESTPTA